MDILKVGTIGTLILNDTVIAAAPDWKPQRRLRRADGTVSPIEYFKLDEGSAAKKYFLSQYHRHLTDLVKYGCRVEVNDHQMSSPRGTYIT
mmetsp:Transcript_27977/g.23137  ORF Transcript_27977/g.23137 Transcript_27977/m.23137 type:complete len:91 (+) Transcript_27977:448-720(+)